MPGKPDQVTARIRFDAPGSYLVTFRARDNADNSRFAVITRRPRVP